MWPAGASGALYLLRGTGRSFRGGPVKYCAQGTVLDSGGLVGFQILEWMPETTRVDPAGHGDVCDVDTALDSI